MLIIEAVAVPVVCKTASPLVNLDGWQGDMDFGAQANHKIAIQCQKCPLALR